MTAKSFWWETGVAGDGSSEYTEVDHSRWTRVVGACFGHEGIGPGYGDAFDAEANPTGGSDRKVRIKTGGAIVDGKPLDQDVQEDHLLDTTPSYRRDRIVLACTWGATNTVRIAVLKGTDGSETPPTIPSPVPGTLVYLALWQVRIVSSGAVSLSADERVWAEPSVDDVTIEISGTGELQVKDDGITAAKINDDAVITAKINDDAVDDTKVGDRVPALIKRQGGSPTDWSTYGNTNYIPTAVKIEVGVAGITVGIYDVMQTFGISFPTAFSQPPVVFATIEYNSVKLVIVTRDITASGFILKISTGDGSTFPVSTTYPIHWMAIGPE